MNRHLWIESTAVVVAVAAAAGAAAGTVAAARGDTRGAPGISKALSRLGRAFGGGMLTGIAVSAGTAALVSLSVYRSVQFAEHRMLG